MPAVDQGALTSLAMGGGSTLPESQLVPIAMGPPPSHGGIIPARVSSEMMDISDPEPYTHQQQQQHHHQDTVPRPLALEYTTPASSGAIVPGVPPPRQGSMHSEYDDQHQHQYSQHHHHSNVNTDRDLPDVPYHPRPTYTPIHHTAHHQQDNNQQQLQLVASTSSAGVPTGPTFEDLVRVLGVGEPFVSSFSGTSQYSNGGPSACGLASMNSVRQIFMKSSTSPHSSKIQTTSRSTTFINYPCLATR
ncbi:hypothetical protein DL93DRAFT_1179324 [Clavulina sp. PMI_390]|nr:hypothetical protein DL93DRAFT_1179324 [Clavulina sp. PMI_390]